jgi:hypothetical protein
VNYELEGMWQEAVVAYCEVLSQHSVGGTEGKHENPQSLLPISGTIFEPVTFQTQGHYFIAQLSVATSCGLIYCTNVAHSSDRLQTGSRVADGLNHNCQLK